MIYEFKAGSHAPKEAIPEETAAALKAVRASRGTLTAESVADHAELARQNGDADDPLLPWFTWDEELGMRKLHVIEAGHVIRAVVATGVVKAQQSPVRAFVLVKDNGSQVYEDIAKVLKHPDQLQVLLDQVSREKAQLDDKFNELVALVQLSAGKS